MLISNVAGETSNLQNLIFFFFRFDCVFLCMYTLLYVENNRQIDMIRQKHYHKKFDGNFYVTFLCL